MGKILTLSGGKEIEVYTNTHCPLCGKETYQTVCCHFYEANVCYKHYGECRNFRKEFQQCVYKPLPKEIRRFCKEKTTGK
nr:MAG TPA: NADH-PPase NADH pyrophosphatase zinc ribbon domain [Caudoviricetes sp.]